MTEVEGTEGYFLSNRSRIQVHPVGQITDTITTTLREAQAGAYWGVCSHFTAREDPSLVVMPTGSGKTAVMTLLAFALVQRRLLILAPGRVILDQIEREFQTLKIARTSGCIPSGLEAPKIHCVRHKLGTAEEWQRLRKFDVVLSTPNCASPQYDDVFSIPPPDLFDTLFIDEAHHWPASTWRSLASAFPRIRIVGFTATPFRNDKSPVPGEIVYSYPLARAIKNGIYRPVELVSVSGLGDEKMRDRRLAERAKEILEEDPLRQAKLLVRVRILDETKKIQTLYQDLGLNLEIVASDRSLVRNEFSIRKAREDEQCHGLIAVGMLGEGLDLPALEIAVMHRPHQSFSVTLQFIGRICRMSGELGRSAKLLVIPEEVQDHTKGLYEADANWAELIPDLADAAVDRERDRRRFAKEGWDTTTDSKMVSVHTLRPLFSVAAYQVGEPELDITREPELHTGTTVFQSFLSDDRKWRVFITRTITKPAWTTSDSLLDVDFDLLIYYLVHGLLFESSTSAGIASQLRESLGANRLPRVPPDRIEQVLSQSDVLAYYNVGMRKAAFAGSNVPTYKMMAGSHAEDTVREADGRFFSVGHLFGRVTWGEDELVLGMSCSSAKIWSATRDHLQEFTAWCDAVANRLLSKVPRPLPYVGHLKRPELIDLLPARPYAAELHDRFYDHLAKGLRIEILGEADCVFDGSTPIEIAVDRDRWDSAAPQECVLRLVFSEVEIEVAYDLTESTLFSCVGSGTNAGYSVKLPEKGRFRDVNLDQYLKGFPPTVYLADGSAVAGRYLYRYQPPTYNIPDSVLQRVDWNDLNCEIMVEDSTLVRATRRKEMAVSGKVAVLDATAEHLGKSIPSNAILFCDHGSGEIADFLVIERVSNGTQICLYHCKASREPKPGVRQDDAYDVIAQARKCTRWLRRRDLFEVLRDRISKKGLIKGSSSDLDGMLLGSTPQIAKYRVFIVQPGFDINKMQTWQDESIRLMLLSLYDELASDGIHLIVLGS